MVYKMGVNDFELIDSVGRIYSEAEDVARRNGVSANDVFNSIGFDPADYHMSLLGAGKQKINVAESIVVDSVDSYAIESKPPKKSKFKKYVTALGSFLLGGALLVVAAYGMNMDSDKDGLSDRIESGIGTNPYNWDSDNDGLSDGIEVGAPKNIGIFGHYSEHWPNPLAMDLYVELDGIELPIETKLAIIDFFKNSPINNTDGSKGIRLHLDDGTKDFDLGGGERLDVDGVYVKQSNTMNQLYWENFYNNKFFHNRKGIFHYGLIIPRILDLEDDVLGIANLSLTDENNVVTDGDGNSNIFVINTNQYGGDDNFVVSYNIAEEFLKEAHLNGKYQNWTFPEVLTQTTTHELLHNLLGYIEEVNLGRWHSDWPEDLMYPMFNENTKKLFLHQELWDELQRDGIGISFEKFRKR